jgi:hypothetical protein
MEATGPDACNESRSAIKAEVKRMLQLLNPVTRICDKPPIAQFREIGRRTQGDGETSTFQTPTANYIIDTSIGLAAADSAPLAVKNKAAVFA